MGSVVSLSIATASHDARRAPAWASTRITTRARRQVFEAVDNDGNGAVSCQEFCAFFAEGVVLYDAQREARARASVAQADAVRREEGARAEEEERIKEEERRQQHMQEQDMHTMQRAVRENKVKREARRQAAEERARGDEREVQISLRELELAAARIRDHRESTARVQRYAALNEEQERREGAAALQIQKMYRGGAARRRYHEEEEQRRRVDAAVRIQRMRRGGEARRRYKKLVQHKQHRQLALEAATAATGLRQLHFAPVDVVGSAPVTPVDGDDAANVAQWEEREALRQEFAMSKAQRLELDLMLQRVLEVPRFEHLTACAVEPAGMSALEQYRWAQATRPLTEDELQLKAASERRQEEYEALHLHSLQAQLEWKRRRMNHVKFGAAKELTVEQLASQSPEETAGPSRRKKLPLVPRSVHSSQGKCKISSLHRACQRVSRAAWRLTPGKNSAE